MLRQKCYHASLPPEEICLIEWYHSMPDDEIQIGEDEWQEYVNELLGVHHSLLNEVYQTIPDIGGDRGLEGFCQNGHAYQAYADQNSKNFKERTRKQKKKIRDDLKKLDKYATWWTSMLQSVKLKCWTLLVPNLNDKEVVKYAREQAALLVAKGHSFIDPSFFATVRTAKGFPNARVMLSEPGLARKVLCPLPVTQDQIDQLHIDHPTFLGNLDRKIASLMPNATPEEIVKKREQYLNHHLECSNYLDDLRRKFQPLWESVDRLITTTAKAIETDTGIGAAVPSNRLKDVREGFAKDITSKTKKFATEEDIIVLSYGTIAKWLGICNLEFPEARNAE